MDTVPWMFYKDLHSQRVVFLDDVRVHTKAAADHTLQQTINQEVVAA